MQEEIPERMCAGSITGKGGFMVITLKATRASMVLNIE